jgi:EmrB/QacA subfamily drug resistance transporter
MTATERSALFASTVTIFMAPFMASSVNVALPAIQADLAADAVQLSWVATAYILAMAMAMIPVGRFADIHGRKKVFLAGIVTYSISCSATALVPSISWLIGLRVVQGFGAALFISTGMAILTSIFPPERRGRAMGIYAGAVYLGASVGPFVGGVITRHLGWRSIFVIMLLLGVASFVAVIRNIKAEWADARGEPLDITGAIVYAVALCTLVFGATHLPGPSAWFLLIAGLIGLVLFVCLESRNRYPLIDISLFRDNRIFLFSSLAALINYSATYAVTFVLSLFLQYLKGMPPEMAGMVLMVQPIMQTCVSPLAGRWSDGVEARLLASGGMALTMIGLAGLALVGPQTRLGIIIALLVVLGTGLGLFVSPNTLAIMGAVPQHQYGIASGVSSTVRLMGQIASMTIATLVLSIYIGREPIQPANYPMFLKSSHIIFSFFGFACAVGVFFSFSRGRSRSA